MIVAFIPVRGGSKSIPLKNIKEISGKPLIYWTVKAASECEEIDKVFVSTDSDKIRETVEKMNFGKVSVIGRSAESATDTASTEFAMLEFANQYDFDSIVLIQATSPMLTAKNIDEGIKTFKKDGVDSVLSVVRQKRFVWNSNGKTVSPINYDPQKRPRRQEFDGFLVENGAFYITSKEELLKTGTRISGNVAAVEMPEETYFEIDEPSDWVVIEHLLKKQTKNTTYKNIKMVLTDSDGVLTDAGMYYSETGDELKKFNARDGMGFERLRKNGILTGIITGEKGALIERRAKKVCADVLVMGAKEKLSEIDRICKEYKIERENIAYIGDDIIDIPVMQAVGASFAPADCEKSVGEIAGCICKNCGGRGVFREVAELILENR